MPSGAVALFLACLLVTAPALGQAASAASEPPQKSLRDLITDDEDGWLDVSEMVLARSYFLPIPILITEPALGYGFGLAPVWFHEPPDRSSGQLLPPSLSLLAGFATSDGSWGGGGGHFHSFKNDTWRVLGVAAYAELELESAGISTSLEPDRFLEYSIDNLFVLAEASRKMSPRTRLGLRYLYVQSEVGLKDLDPSSDRSLSGDSTIGGLGLYLSFDSRDSILTPTKGQRFDLRPAYYGALFGGDSEYIRVDTLYTGYWRRGPLGFALRIDADWIQDEAPFYAKPYLALRGVPAVAFLGEQVLSAEPEIDWTVHPRWTLLAFAGAGRTTNDFRIQGEVNRDIHTGGVGFRYLLARAFGLQAGLDFAWSSEGDHAVYIVVGSPWR